MEPSRVPPPQDHPIQPWIGCCTWQHCQHCRLLHQARWTWAIHHHHMSPGLAVPQAGSVSPTSFWQGSPYQGMLGRSRILAPPTQDKAHIFSKKTSYWSLLVNKLLPGTLTSNSNQSNDCTGGLTFELYGQLAALLDHISWFSLNHWPHHFCWNSVCYSGLVTRVVAPTQSPQGVSPEWAEPLFSVVFSGYVIKCNQLGIQL